MHISYRVQLDPNAAQAAELARYAGTARKIWNWGLAETRKALDNKEKMPSAFDLQKQITQMKKTEEWQWLTTVSKSVPEVALANLDDAWRKCFEKIRRRPRFKSYYSQKKGFGLNNPSDFTADVVRLPKLGKIKLARQNYVPVGRYATAQITCKNNKWYVAVRKEVEEQPLSEDRPWVGVDVGVVNLITTSSGICVKNPRVLKKTSKKIRRRQKALSRSKRGSKNRAKAKQRLARLHEKVKNIRSTNLHRITKVLATSFSVIAIEDLKLMQMSKKSKKMQKRSLNLSLRDASFGELRRQIEYKAKLYGSVVVAVDPAYTSQRCNCCGFISRDNRLTQSKFKCLECGESAHADVNAAQNILERAVAVGGTEIRNACGSALRPAPRRAQAAGTKQEENL